MFKKGDLYKDFEVFDVFDVADFHSTAVHIVHKKTGMEIVHFVNDDNENLFSFSFRTPNFESNGAAHILEHSVLCGSERFPLKDPFVVLSNQSVKTYLNAMTYPDRTVFPASSIVKADYFNLMNVYGDAVFFPNLKPEIFLQEAHRLEVDEDGKASIQGVVYNEMKGDYSSFESSVSSACNGSLLKGSVYEKDSGGDPLCIPSITHEKLKEFHKKWYRPDNCLVFLYGNIPTNEQLDFIQDKFLNRLEQKFSEYDYSQLSNEQFIQKKRNIVDEFLKYVTPKKNEKPVEIKCEGPGDSESLNTVVVNWSFGKTENADCGAINTFLTGILLNHDGSPLQKALTESDLGEDIAPQTGFAGYLYDSILSLGLRGVKDGDEKKVEKLIFDTLNELVKNGISKNDIESTMMSLEYSQRSIKRIDGPYSKVLMGRIVYGWLYGYELSRQIRQRDVLEKIKAKINSEPYFLENRIKEFLIENKNRSLVVVTPTKKFAEKRELAEQKIISELMKNTSVEKIREENEKLHQFQKKVDDASCLPHINPFDFFVDGKPMMNRIKTEFGEIEGVDFNESKKKIPVFKNYENTNGIVYFKIGFPADMLDVQDYPYIPTFTDACVDVGWTRKSDNKFLDWAESSEQVALHTGAFGCYHMSTIPFETEEAMKNRRNCNWIGRDWIIFRVAMIEEETENALQLLSDCLTSVDFSDLKRIQDIIVEGKNDFDSSIVSEGHSYSELRSKNGSTHSATVEEMWNGLSQLYTLHKIVDCDKAELAKRYKKMFSEIKNGGAFIQIVAEKSGIEKVCSILPKFINDVGIKSLQNQKMQDEAEFEKLTELPFEKIEKSDKSEFEMEVCVLNTQVGFAAEYIEANPYGTESEALSDLCSHWLSNNLLWERIRTIGGAYGAFSSSDPMPGGFTFITYRDPSPFTSCETFDKCLKESSEIELSEESVKKAIVGNYSHWIQPQTPSGRGSTALHRILSGLSDVDRERKLNWILNATSEKMNKTFKDIFEKIGKSTKIKKRQVVLCGENSLQTLTEDVSYNRKIVHLPI